MRERERLTERIVRAAKPRDRKYQIFDAETLGLSVCIYPSGLRSFLFDFRVAGRQRRYTIGRWPDWNVTAARDRVRVLRRDLDAGEDPLAQRVSAREAPRMSDLIERYLLEHASRLAPRNASDQASMLRQLVAPQWGSCFVTEIGPMDVDALLTVVASGRARPAKKPAQRKRSQPIAPVKPTPVRANRLGEVLRKMFNLAMLWKMRDDNPAATFRRRTEVERDRFLAPEEIERLAAALDNAEDQRAAGIIRMCMLTGARLGEVRNARFEQFDLNQGAWHKPAANTKQRRVHRVPISSETAELVRLRRLAVPEGCGWLFPGEVVGKDQPVQDIRRFWARLQAEADLPGVRIHDLRHTFASLLVNGGASLEMIGRLLGHTQAKTTLRYAHLMDSPLREGVDTVAAMMRAKPRLVHDADEHHPLNHVAAGRSRSG